MMERAKVIRRRSWLFELLVCLELLAIMGAWWGLTGSWMAGILFGECFYLVLAWTLRLTLQRHHWRGMRLMRRQDYEGALAAFEESFRFLPSIHGSTGTAFSPCLPAALCPISRWR